MGAMFPKRKYGSNLVGSTLCIDSDDDDSDSDDDCQLSRLAEFDLRQGIDPMSEFVNTSHQQQQYFLRGGDIAIRLMRLQINLLAL